MRADSKWREYMFAKFVGLERWELVAGGVRLRGVWACAIGDLGMGFMVAGTRMGTDGENAGHSSELHWITYLLYSAAVWRLGDWLSSLFTLVCNRFTVRCTLFCEYTITLPLLLSLSHFAQLAS